MKKTLLRSVILTLVLAFVLQIVPFAGAAAQDSEPSDARSLTQYVVVCYTYILDEASSAGALVTSVSAGTHVTLLSGTWTYGTTTWLKVQYGSYTGYIRANCICPANSCYKVNTTAGLNLRSGPGTNYDIKCSLSYGTYLYRTGSTGGWYYVYVMSGNYAGMYGYVSSSYVTNA